VRTSVVRGSGGPTKACTARARVTECDREPLMPCAVIVKLPVAAFGSTPKTTRAVAPVAILNWLAGFATTPFGTPARVTWTVPVNPFCAVTEIAIGAPVVPWEMDSELEESVMAKSGEGVEAGLMFDDGLLLPPPHPAQRSEDTATCVF
jgi:hypothetical protein